MSAFFVLMSGAWSDADSHLCRPLLGSRTGRPPLLPWVAIARGVSGGGYDLVGRDGLTAADARGFVAEATSHLDACARSWQVAATSGFLFFKRPSMVRPIVAQPPGATPEPMDDLSSEQILNPKALAEAGASLRSQELLVVIPKRGWMLALAGRAGEFPRMMVANQAASGVFGRAGKDALSPYAFFTSGGRLTGANVLEGSSGFMHLAAPDEAGWLVPS